MLFLIFISFSCNKKGNKEVEGLLSNNLKATNEINDSIIISVNFKSEGKIAFNIKDKYHQYYFLGFINNSQKDTTIVKKIPRIFKNQLIDYFGFENKNGKPEFFENYFLIDSTKNEILFNYSNEKATLISHKDKNDINSIHSIYNKLDVKIKNSGKLNEDQKKKLYSELEMLYTSSLEKASKIEKELIKTYYISILQKIYPQDKRIDDFMKNIKSPMACNPFSSILFNYTDDRIEMFNFSKLNETNYTKEYIDILSIGIFNFLRFEGNKGNEKYKLAKDWLIKTDLYSNDSIYIKNEITPKDSLILKQKLEKLTFIDVKDNPYGIRQVVKNKTSKYYLIDFWTTWCSPCIQNIKSIHKMDLPKNLSIIYISMDKGKDKGKWSAKSEELNLNNSFLFVENESNKNIINEIELNQLPRYILIDKDFNMLNTNMITPQEGDFLKELKSYIKE
ncbi:hypothetical protein FIA58_013425 [Flavobacterium jejuense]|uniref:Thioredoxin-like fold domain-containing protein n=1 Tax=Flavobacterium jejuense TaxID=1544455 RepID=A0ABX0IU46_9FLAO|nr:thioredoxin-like domain-containing protein [Flavobacterium jejuense]NHN26680.1 hypothetical protein [Flavobacterium jejuense]